MHQCNCILEGRAAASVFRLQVLGAERILAAECERILKFRIRIDYKITVVGNIVIHVLMKRNTRLDSLWRRQTDSSVGIIRQFIHR